MKKFISIVTLLAMLLSAVSFAAPVVDQAVEGIDEYQEVVTDTTNTNDNASLAADVVDDGVPADYIDGLGTLIYSIDFESYQPTVPQNSTSSASSLSGLYKGKGVVHFSKQGGSSTDTVVYETDAATGSKVLHFTGTAGWGSGLMVGLFESDIKGKNIRTEGKPIDLNGGKITMVFDIKGVGTATTSPNMVLNWNIATVNKGGLSGYSKDEYKTCSVTFDVDSTNNILFAFANNCDFYLDNLKFYYDSDALYKAAHKEEYRQYGTIVYSNTFDSNPVGTSTNLVGALAGKGSVKVTANSGASITVANGEMTTVFGGSLKGVAFDMYAADGTSPLDLSDGTLTLAYDLKISGATKPVMWINLNYKGQKSTTVTAATTSYQTFYEPFVLGTGNPNAAAATRYVFTHAYNAAATSDTFTIDNVKLYYMSNAEKAKIEAEIAAEKAALEAQYGQLIYEQTFNSNPVGVSTELVGPLAGKGVVKFTKNLTPTITVANGELTSTFSGSLHGFFIDLYDMEGNNFVMNEDDDLTLFFDLKVSGATKPQLWRNLNWKGQDNSIITAATTSYQTFVEPFVLGSGNPNADEGTRYAFTHPYGAAATSDTFTIDNVRLYFKDNTPDIPGKPVTPDVSVPVTLAQTRQYGSLVYSNNLDVADQIKITTLADKDVKNMNALGGALEGLYLKISPSVNGGTVSYNQAGKIDFSPNNKAYGGLLFTICDANGNDYPIYEDMLHIMVDFESSTSDAVSVFFNQNINKQTNLGSVNATTKNWAVRNNQTMYNTVTAAQNTAQTPGANSQGLAGDATRFGYIMTTASTSTFSIDNLRVFCDKAQGTWNSAENFDINEKGKFADAPSISTGSKFDLTFAQVVEDGNGIGKINVAAKAGETVTSADINIQINVNDAVQASQIERIQIRYKYDTPYHYTRRGATTHAFTGSQPTDVSKAVGAPKFYSKPGSSAFSDGTMGLSDGTTVKIVPKTKFDRFASNWQLMEFTVPETESDGYFNNGYIILPLETDETLYIDYIRYVLRPDEKPVSNMNASINVDDSADNKTGIRFLSDIYSEIVADEETRQYGFIATLQSKLDAAGVDAYDFTLSNAAFPEKAGNSTNYIVGIAYDPEYNINIIYDLDDETGDKTISGVFYGIPAGKYDTEIVMRPFVVKEITARKLASGKFYTYSYGEPMVGTVQDLAKLFKYGTLDIEGQLDATLEAWTESAFKDLSIEEQAIVNALIANEK